MRNYLIVILIFICSCSAQKNSLKKIENVTEDNIVDISYQKEANGISFTIKNLNNSEISYVKRNKLEIDRLLNGEWIRVKILPCPCDAPCKEINQDILIKPNKSLNIDWNMTESWCGKKENEFVRETITKKVENGEYRISIMLKDVDGIFKQISKEFIIN